MGAVATRMSWATSGRRAGSYADSGHRGARRRRGSGRARPHPGSIAFYLPGPRILLTGDAAAARPGGQVMPRRIQRRPRPSRRIPPPTRRPRCRDRSFRSRRTSHSRRRGSATSSRTAAPRPQNSDIAAGSPENTYYPNTQAHQSSVAVSLVQNSHHLAHVNPAHQLTVLDKHHK